MSQEQLHGVRNPSALGRDGRRTTQSGSARPCGMEAGDAVLHRTKVKLRKACASWMSVRPNATSISRSSSTCSGDGVARNLTHLTQGDLWSSAGSGLGRWGGLSNDPSTRLEKSDRLVRALKPGNAGGAKGTTE